jgi:hypothetical protein
MYISSPDQSDSVNAPSAEYALIYAYSWVLARANRDADCALHLVNCRRAKFKVLREG